jgi:hypothetical protein
VRPAADYAARNRMRMAGINRVSSGYFQKNFRPPDGFWRYIARIVTQINHSPIVLLFPAHNCCGYVAFFLNTTIKKTNANNAYTN